MRTDGLDSTLIESEPAVMGLTTRVWEENKKIWRIAFPSILARVSSFGLLVVTQSFIGHINWLDMAAYALIQSVIALPANGILMYLQAQLKNRVIGCLFAVAFPCHLLLSWIFVNKLRWGVPGAMSALNISQWSVVFGEMWYIFGGWCPDTWKGFSIEAFKDLIPVIKQSISSGFMLWLEMCYTSVLVLLAGYSSDAEVDISAFSICLNLNSWVLMIFLGFLGASCVRVANELGRGNAYGAKFAIKVCLSISSIIGVVFWILCLVFGRKIPYLFTNDTEVAEAASSLSVLLAFTMLLTSLQATFSGVAIGSGSQAKVAIINLCSYYIVGVPVGAVLGYVADFGVKGIWIGLICGLSLQVISLVIMTSRIDWNEEVDKALSRLNEFLLDTTEESSSNQTSPFFNQLDDSG